MLYHFSVIFKHLQLLLHKRRYAVFNIINYLVFVCSWDHNIVSAYKMFSPEGGFH